MFCRCARRTCCSLITESMCSNFAVLSSEVECSSSDFLITDLTRIQELFPLLRKAMSARVIYFQNKKNGTVPNSTTSILTQISQIWSICRPLHRCEAPCCVFSISCRSALPPWWSEKQKPKPCCDRRTSFNARASPDLILNGAEFLPSTTPCISRQKWRTTSSPLLNTGALWMPFFEWATLPRTEWNSPFEGRSVTLCMLRRASHLGESEAGVATY